MNNTNLLQFIETCTAGFDTLTDERKTKLSVLSQYIQSKINEETIPLTFICTHNSRRSFFAQVWAQVAAWHYNVNNIETYSGGTSETAIYASTLKGLEDSGLAVSKLTEGNNPVSAVRYHEHRQPVIGFSKQYDHTFNPSGNFAAVMTCGDADANCPFIPQAAARISLTYVDPKQFDGTMDENEAYLNKSKEIATEMLYVFHQIKLS